jgi:uncharacterized protein
MLGWALGLSLLAAPAARRLFRSSPATRWSIRPTSSPRPKKPRSIRSSSRWSKTTGHQFVVATVSDLEGNDIADYGYKLGRAWGIGDEAKDDGVVFLIAPNERRMNISVGSGSNPSSPTRCRGGSSATS